MIIRNPVYVKEVRVNNRSYRQTSVFLIFNGLLAAVGLYVLGKIIGGMNKESAVNYSMILQLYTIISTLECCMLLLIVPGLTAGSISGERERQTFDSLVGTAMTPVSIILGKLMAVMGTVFLLLISSLPVLSLVFIFGGIRYTDLFWSLGGMFVLTFYVASAGICFSSWCSRSLVSAIVSYAFLFFSAGGTVLISRLTQILGLESDVVADVGNRAVSWYHYFLLCNPIVTFYSILNRQAGSHNAILDFINYRNEYQANLVTEHWILISLMVQVLLAVLFLWMAVQGIKNKK
mgnify:CR=1 FL=1